MSDLSPSDAAKLAAARAAVARVQDGMKLGLGTGSTAVFMVRELAARVQAEGLTLHCAATSQATADLAVSLGLNVAPLDALAPLDLTIDGADEVDPDLNLIKGGGAAHLREKIVAASSNRMIVIADPTKVVEHLGAFPLPVEVLEFGITNTRALIATALTDLGYADVAITLREKNGAPVVTDEGNRILDLAMGQITDPAVLCRALAVIPGVVENGLFIALCDLAIIGQPDGTVRELARPGATEDETLAADPLFGAAEAGA